MAHGRPQGIVNDPQLAIAKLGQSGRRRTSRRATGSKHSPTTFVQLDARVAGPYRTARRAPVRLGPFTADNDGSLSGEQSAGGPLRNLNQSRWGGSGGCAMKALRYPLFVLLALLVISEPVIPLRATAETTGVSGWFMHLDR